MILERCKPYIITSIYIITCGGVGGWGREYQITIIITVTVIVTVIMPHLKAICAAGSHCPVGDGLEVNALGAPHHSTAREQHPSLAVNHTVSKRVCVRVCARVLTIVMC